MAYTRKRFLDDVKGDVIDCYLNKNMSAYGISKKYNVSVPTVINFLRANNVKTLNKNDSHLKRVRKALESSITAIDCYLDGKIATQKEAAVYCKCSIQTFRRRMRNLINLRNKIGEDFKAEVKPEVEAEVKHETSEVTGHEHEC